MALMKLRSAQALIMAMRHDHRDCPWKGLTALQGHGTSIRAWVVAALIVAQLGLADFREQTAILRLDPNRPVHSIEPTIDRMAGRSCNIRTRSFQEIMYFLSQSVEAPEVDLAADRMAPPGRMPARPRHVDIDRGSTRLKTDASLCEPVRFTVGVPRGICVQALRASTRSVSVASTRTDAPSRSVPEPCAAYPPGSSCRFFRTFAQAQERPVPCRECFAPAARARSGLWPRGRMLVTACSAQMRPELTPA